MSWKIRLLGALVSLLILSLFSCSSSPVKVNGIARWESSPNYLTIVLSPTSSTEIDKTYLVEVLETGIVRTKGSVSWTQTELNVRADKCLNFPAREEEVYLYPLKTNWWSVRPLQRSRDLRGFFEVRVVEVPAKEIPVAETPTEKGFQWWWILAGLGVLLLLFFSGGWLLDLLEGSGRRRYGDEERRKLEGRRCTLPRYLESPKPTEQEATRSKVETEPPKVVQDIVKEAEKLVRLEKWKIREEIKEEETRRREVERKEEIEKWRKETNLEEVIKKFKPVWRSKTTLRGKVKRRLEGDEKGTTANLARYLRGKGFKAETEISFPGGRKADLVVNRNTIVEAKPNLMYPGKADSLVGETLAHQRGSPNYKLLVVIYGDAKRKYVERLRYSIGETIPVIILGDIK